MASTHLERTRLLHQDLEKQQHRAVVELLSAPKTNKETIAQQHRVKTCLDRYRDSATKLLEIYDDADGTRAEELRAIAGDEVYGTFYQRLKETREYHRRFPNASQVEEGDELLEVDVEFSGQEHHGRYLDLHPLFVRFLNMPHFHSSNPDAEKPDFLQYLRTFYKFDSVPRSYKLHGPLGSDYQSYLDDLLAYLSSFHARIHPLVNQEEMWRLVEGDFDRRWAQRDVPGWFDANGAPVEAEAQTALYCIACQKQFAKDTVFQAHLTGKKHSNAEKKRQAGLALVGQESTQQWGGGAGEVVDPGLLARVRKELLRARELALKEAKIQALCDVLSPQLQATQQLMEKKQTWTLKEMEAEMKDESEGEAEELESDSDEETFINYKNVPLGWDGKPIPYWLYKLHGLNLEFSCEICGNYKYRGPRAFERHFFEARHAYGMRCLGIPMTKHFANVTLIEDARVLHEKIKRMSREKEWRSEDLEEFEDNEGNVFSKKTFEDLKRQGII